MKALPNPNPPAAKPKKKWKFERKVSMKTAFPYKKRGMCRYCHGKAPGNRVYWCSDECVVAALILCGDLREIKRCLLLRDKGVCAACGLDTLKLKRDVKKSGKKASALDLPSGRNRYWDIEHKLPVIEGGGFSTLDNFQTLCISCHKKSTAALAARRAAARKE